jgi:hypothetical protein
LLLLKLSRTQQLQSSEVHTHTFVSAVTISSGGFLPNAISSRSYKFSNGRFPFAGFHLKAAKMRKDLIIVRLIKKFIYYKKLAN